MFTYLRLEPYEGKLSRTVLRRERRGNPSDPANWSRSGKKAWTYARENGLIPQTFCSWVKRAEEKQPAGFVEVPKQLIPAAVPLQEMVIETGELRIHIPLTIRGEELQTILTVLGRFK